MAKKPTEPLKVTATLVDGRIYSRDGVIMFDSILYHAWFLKHAPHVLDGLGEFDPRGYHIGLPLRGLPGNRWAASKGVYEDLSVQVERWNKRPDFFSSQKYGYLDQGKGIISDSVGLYRAYRTGATVRTVKDRAITFYCMGHPEGIEDLLGYMTSIGKKPSMGWGAVAKWEVEPIEEDYSYMHPEYGLMRPTPVEEAELSGYPIQQYAIRPPYWKSKNYRLCYVPIGQKKGVST